MPARLPERPPTHPPACLALFVLPTGEDEEDLEGERQLGPSSHEQRLERLAKKIQRLEEDAMGPRDWFLRGEVDAGGLGRGEVGWLAGWRRRMLWA